MTAADTLHQIAHLDWPVEACEDDRCQEGHPPATHVLRCLLPCRCQPVELICAGCAQRWAARIAEWVGRSACIICRPCSTHYHGAHIPSLYTVNPL